MALPLARRIEAAVESIVATALPSAQVLTFGETEVAGKDYVSIRATRVEEDPPTSGIFAHDVNVTCHGNFTDADVHDLEEIMNNAQALASALRVAGASTFAMPLGAAVEIGANTADGRALDEHFTYNFGVWAQTKEVSDAA